MLYPFGFPLQLYSPGNWAQLVSQGDSDFSQALPGAYSSFVIYIITCSLHPALFFYLLHLLLPPVKTLKNQYPGAVIGFDFHLKCHPSHLVEPQCVHALFAKYVMLYQSNLRFWCHHLIISWQNFSTGALLREVSHIASLFIQKNVIADICFVCKMVRFKV